MLPYIVIINNIRGVQQAILFRDQTGIKSRLLYLRAKMIPLRLPSLYIQKN